MKNRLESLGIDPSLVTSDSQAQAIIAKKELEMCFEECAAVLKDKPEEPAAQKNGTETALIAEIKNIAEQLRLDVDNDATFDEIAALISNEIQAMLNSGDPEFQEMGQYYQTLLSRVTDEYNNVTSFNSGLYSAISMQANNTRYMLGL